MTGTIKDVTPRTPVVFKLELSMSEGELESLQSVLGNLLRNNEFWLSSAVPWWDRQWDRQVIRDLFFYVGQKA